MKWKKILANTLDELNKSADANSITVRAELTKQLHDKNLKWSIVKKWIIASVVQLLIQIASIVFGVFA